jgi:peptidoglycan hydrolase-like protein with peptidoglycan-binding domain
MFYKNDLRFFIIALAIIILFSDYATFNLRAETRRPDLSGLSYEEESSIELACSYDKALGPAKYNKCLQRQLAELKNAPRRLDLSGLTDEEKYSLELACSYEKSLGPAKYNRCMQRQLTEFGLPIKEKPLKKPQPKRIKAKQFTLPQRNATPEIRKAQVLLSKLGYEPGPIDGLLGRKTRKAIENFQIDFGLPETGEVDNKLLNELTAAYEVVNIQETQKIPNEVSKPIYRYYRKLPKTAAILPAMPSKINSRPLRGADLFRKVKSSVFAVLASSSIQAMKQKEDLSQGSAVAVSNKKLLTNCHVFKNRSVIIIIQGKKAARAVLAGKDENSDMCVLSSKDFNLAPIAAIRKFADLAVGETVYTIGTPVGLQQTLGVGIISGLRRYKGLMLIQTTAPISSGSSGGGLFDSNGNLIGITSFLLKDAQNLNFAIAAEQYWK